MCVQLNSFKYRKWLNSSIWHIVGTLLGTATLGQSGPWSNGNEGVLPIPQSPQTGALPSDSFLSYTGHLLVWEEGFYLLAEMPLAYSTAPAVWAEMLIRKVHKSVHQATMVVQVSNRKLTKYVLSKSVTLIFISIPLPSNRNMRKCGQSSTFIVWEICRIIWHTHIYIYIERDNPSILGQLWIYVQINALARQRLYETSAVAHTWVLSSWHRCLSVGRWKCCTTWH